MEASIASIEEIRCVHRQLDRAKQRYEQQQHKQESQPQFDTQQHYRPQHQHHPLLNSMNGRASINIQLLKQQQYQMEFDQHKLFYQQQQNMQNGQRFRRSSVQSSSPFATMDNFDTVHHGGVRTHTKWNEEI